MTVPAPTAPDQTAPDQTAAPIFARRYLVEFANDFDDEYVIGARRTFDEAVADGLAFAREHIEELGDEDDTTDFIETYSLTGTPGESTVEIGRPTYHYVFLTHPDAEPASENDEPSEQPRKLRVTEILVDITP